MHILQWEYMVIHCTLLIKKTEGKRIGIMVYWVDLERAASLGNSYFGGLHESFLLLHLRSISKVRGNKNCFYQNKCNLLACFRCVLNKVIVLKRSCFIEPYRKKNFTITEQVSYPLIRNCTTYRTMHRWQHANGNTRLPRNFLVKAIGLHLWKLQQDRHKQNIFFWSKFKCRAVNESKQVKSMRHCCGNPKKTNMANKQ